MQLCATDVHICDAAAPLRIRPPGGEAAIHEVRGGRRLGVDVQSAGQNVVTDDEDLAFDAAFAGGPVGGRHVDIELVVAGEADRLRIQRDLLARGDVPAHDGLGAVVDRRRRHLAEVLERPPVAVEERLQVLARSCLPGRGGR